MSPSRLIYSANNPSVGVVVFSSLSPPLATTAAVVATAAVAVVAVVAVVAAVVAPPDVAAVGRIKMGSFLKSVGGGGETSSSSDGVEMRKSTIC